MELGRDLVEASLAAAGLPAELVDGDGRRVVRRGAARSHQEAIDRVGDEVGTPTIAFNGSSSSGRSSPGSRAARTPAGSGTARIAIAEFPYFFEIKRTRTGELDFS